MKRRARLPYLFLGAALAAGAAAVMVPPRPEMSTLEDGTRMGLIGATYGTVHEVSQEPLGLRLIRQHVTPPRPSEEFGGHGAEWARRPLSPGSLAVWVRREMRLRDARDEFPWCNGVLIDGDGVEYPNYGGNAPGRGLYGREWVGLQYWFFPAFPRRAARFRLRVAGDAPDRLRPLFEAEVQGPTPGRFPQWSPAPPPVRTRAGSLLVSLLSFETGLGAEDRRLTPTMLRRSRAWSRLVLKVLEDGQPARWTPVGVETRDATGNRWLPYGAERNPAGDGAAILLPNALPRTERAFRLRFELIQTADLTPDRLWTSPSLPIGKREGGVALPIHFRAGGEDADLAWYYSEPRRRKPVASSVQIQLSNAPQSDAAVRVRLVQAVDQRWRELWALPDPREEAGELRTFQFWPRVGSRSARLTFAVGRSRYVELTATPRWVGP
jgi:hypothetical protein